MSPRNAHDPAARAEARNRGLRRVRRSTGLVTAASAAGVAILAGGYAHAMPGKTSTAASTTTLPRVEANHSVPAGGRPSKAETPMHQTQQKSQTQQTDAAKAPAVSPPVKLQTPAQPPTTAANNSPSHVTSGGS